MATHCSEDLHPEIGHAFFGSSSVVENYSQVVTVAGSHLVHFLAHLHAIVVYGPLRRSLGWYDPPSIDRASLSIDGEWQNAPVPIRLASIYQ
jgi:hypothetical protein